MLYDGTMLTERMNRLHFGGRALNQTCRLVADLLPFSSHSHILKSGGTFAHILYMDQALFVVNRYEATQSRNNGTNRCQSITGIPCRVERQQEQ